MSIQNKGRTVEFEELFGSDEDYQRALAKAEPIEGVGAEPLVFCGGPFDGESRLVGDAQQVILHAAFGAGDMSGQVVYTRGFTFEPGVEAMYYAGPTELQVDDAEADPA